jgi:hypothetical protein
MGDCSKAACPLTVMGPVTVRSWDSVIAPENTEVPVDTENDPPVTLRVLAAFVSPALVTCSQGIRPRLTQACPLQSLKGQTQHEADCALQAASHPGTQPM